MKQMKLALMALVAVFMGMTFTSCLDSDNDPTEYAYVTINNYLGYVTSMTTDNGLTLIPQNPQAMTEATGGIPFRAHVSYELAEGEKYQNNVTEYKVYFKQYIETFFDASMSEEPVNSLSPIMGLGRIWCSVSGYLNIESAFYTDKNISDRDFGLFVKEVKDNTIHFKMVLNKEIEKSSAYSAKVVSFLLEDQDWFESTYSELSADKDGYYNAILEIDTLDESSKEIEFKTESFKIIIPKK